MLTEELIPLTKQRIPTIVGYDTKANSYTIGNDLYLGIKPLKIRQGRAGGGLALGEVCLKRRIASSPNMLFSNKSRRSAMHRRQWDAKAMSALAGLRGKPVAELCTEH